MKRTMRKAIVAIASGLPVALLAHAVTFGGGHSLGGALHGLFLDLAFLAVVCGAGLAAVHAFGLARCKADGSVVATRLIAGLPTAAALALAGAGWLWAIESLETPHAHPVLLLGLAVAASAWIGRRAIALALRALAAIVVSLLDRHLGDRFARPVLALELSGVPAGRLDRSRPCTRPPPIRS